MKAFIARLSQSAMQSGVAKTKSWVITLNSDQPNMKWSDPVTGWTSTKNTQSQIKLYFENLEDCLDYVNSHGYEYEVINSSNKKAKKQSYQDALRMRSLF